MIERKSSTRWMQSRLDRLECKLKRSPADPVAVVYNDMSPESLRRCNKRAIELQLKLGIRFLPQNKPMFVRADYADYGRRAEAIEAQLEVKQ